MAPSHVWTISSHRIAGDAEGPEDVDPAESESVNDQPRSVDSMVDSCGMEAVRQEFRILFSTDHTFSLIVCSDPKRARQPRDAMMSQQPPGKPN